MAVFFAFWSWVGFEAAPNYAEEAKDPVRVIPIALIFSCVAVGTLYTFMSWAIVSVYGTNVDWSKIGNEGSTALIDGQTVPAHYNNFVLGTGGGGRRRVLARRAELPDHHRVIGLRRSAHERGAALHVRDGPRGAPAALPRPDASGAQVAVHRRSDLGAFATVIFLIFRLTDHTGLDAYFWLSPQGVIWIVLVQALTALSVFMYFKRDRP